MSTIPSLICGVSGCDKQTDIVLRSSDGVLLGAHAADLARYSKDLLQYEDTSLTEDAATLGILLVLFHPRLPPPALDELSPSHLIALAEATEKYAALPITQELCRMAIRVSVHENLHTQNVAVYLNYAYKHHQRKMANELAERLLKTASPASVSAHLDGEAYSAWLKLHEAECDRLMAWLGQPRPVPVNLHKGGSTRCRFWNKYVDDVRRYAFVLLAAPNRAVLVGPSKTILTFMDSHAAQHFPGVACSSGCSNDAAYRGSVKRWWGSLGGGDLKFESYAWPAGL